MSETLLLLARHGATALSHDDFFCGSSDVALSPVGERQAQALALALKDAQLAAVYSSPLARAVATAAPVAARHGLVPQTVAGLREMHFGSWEGRSRREILAGEPDTYRRWTVDPAANAAGGGENGYTVAARAVPALLELLAAHAGRAILVVAHKTVNRILLAHLLGLPLRGYRDSLTQDAGVLNRVLVAPDGRARAIVLNDRSHFQPK